MARTQQRWIDIDALFFEARALRNGCSRFVFSDGIWRRPEFSQLEEPTAYHLMMFEFTKDILDKQFRTYAWSEGKLQALVTIDAALVAGSLVLAGAFRGSDSKGYLPMVPAVICLIVSFLVCLWHTIPWIDSGIGNDKNLRTITCARRFSKEDYYMHVSALRPEDLIRLTAWQVAGMSRNNIRSERLIKSGVVLTIFGTLLLAGALPIIVTSADRASHKEVSVTVDRTPPEAVPVVNRERSVESGTGQLKPAGSAPTPQEPVVLRPTGLGGSKPPK